MNNAINLFKVLDGILDQKEDREEKLDDIDRIIYYGAVIGITITEKEASYIQIGGHLWISIESSGISWAEYEKDTLEFFNEVLVV